MRLGEQRAAAEIFQNAGVVSRPLIQKAGEILKDMGAKVRTGDNSVRPLDFDMLYRVLLQKRL